MKKLVQALLFVGILAPLLAEPDPNRIKVAQQLYRDTVAILTGFKLDPAFQMETMSPNSVRVVVSCMVLNNKYDREQKKKVAEAIADRILKEPQYHRVTVAVKSLDTRFHGEGKELKTTYRENLAEQVVIHKEKPKQQGNANPAP